MKSLAELKFDLKHVCAAQLSFVIKIHMHFQQNSNLDLGRQNLGWISSTQISTTHPIHQNRQIQRQYQIHHRH